MDTFIYRDIEFIASVFKELENILGKSFFALFYYRFETSFNIIQIERKFRDESCVLPKSCYFGIHLFTFKANTLPHSPF